MQAVEQYLREVFRVLKMGGSFILITHGTPDTRLMYLEDEHLQWSIQSTCIGTRKRITKMQ